MTESLHLFLKPSSYCNEHSGSEFKDAGSICTVMYCRDPISGNVQHTAARGNSCANKKENCLLGDQPSIAFINKTCDELINELPQYCYKDKVRARCCSSCAKHFSWIAGCEYGDRVLGCKDFHCNMVEDPKVLTDCCKTCSYGTLIPTTPAPDFSVHPFPTEKPSDHRPRTCTDFAEINGKSCPSFISERGRYSCYDNRIAAYCCATCRAMLSFRSPDCPYGDRLPGFCSQQVNVTDRWCNNFRPHCCDTCSVSSAHNVFRLSLPSVFIAVILFLFSL
ncbi:uncharacterized protein LOC134233180 [Saccostrea cucullata]|uniref:uncharacterized protein LOC134233180 n=1 Tax=Saccostrea cuccullata TaxID=36930 RepID=UPI002ED3296D